MRKVQLAVCMGDKEYERRFLSCLMKHYAGQIELHLYSRPEEVGQKEPYDVLLSDLPPEDFFPEGRRGTPFVCLLDSDSPCDCPEGEGIVYADKYQKVNRIVERILSAAQAEESRGGFRAPETSKTRVLAVYSLTESGFQLPYALLVGSILGERERVLFLDWQENSGFCGERGVAWQLGMEELFVMGETGEYTKARLLACTEHGEGMDYVYPVERAECLGELTGAMCQKVIAMLCAELDYDVLLLNFGARFPGFLEVLTGCGRLFLLGKQGGACRWREESFLEELEQNGYGAWRERICRVEIPAFSAGNISCEALAERWRWNEMGDSIRRWTAKDA